MFLPLEYESPTKSSSISSVRAVGLPTPFRILAFVCIATPKTTESHS